MNILVLGGNGYLGSKIINKFDSSDNVYCTIREREGLNLLQLRKNVNCICADIREINRVLEKKSIDLLINTVCCYERLGVRLSNVIDSNLIFPVTVISKAIEQGVNKIITVDTALPEQINLYSLTKKMVGEIGKYYCQKNPKLTFYNVQLENFYGKDEPKNRFLHQVVKQLEENTTIELTAGTQHRDFIYIDDVIQAIFLLIKNKEHKGYFDVPVGTGEGPTIREVVEYLKDITQSRSLLAFGAIPSRKNEPDCVADMTFLNCMGFVLKFPYKTGLKEIIK